jgi:hypothetical protein
MTEEEIKNKKDPWIPTPEELEKLKENLAVKIEHDTNLLIKNRQQETLKNLEKYNESRKTEIVGDSVNPVMERPAAIEVCEFCANFVYPGQLHGLGYCKEKIQYEQ